MIFLSLERFEVTGYLLVPRDSTTFIKEKVKKACFKKASYVGVRVTSRHA